MPPKRATLSQQPQRDPNREPVTSIYKVTLCGPAGQSPFGKDAAISEASLVTTLSEFGPVYKLDMHVTHCFATFKSTETVQTLTEKRAMSINGILVTIKPLVYNSNNPLARPPFPPPFPSTPAALPSPHCSAAAAAVVPCLW